MRYSIPDTQTSIAFRAPVKSRSIIYSFFKWSAVQDKQHHIAWTGICLLATTAVFFPLTMAAVLWNGGDFALIITAMIALMLVAVLNLAAMPTRYTIPAFMMGILIDVCIIITSFLIH